MSLFLAVALVAVGCRSGPPPGECRVITARTFTVGRVIDGDTFTVQYDGESTSVRLAGIDAPEIRAPGGEAARNTLAEMIAGRTVRLDFTGPRKRDNFGRLLARVYVVEGVDVAGEMVRRGHAVVWRP